MIESFHPKDTALRESEEALVCRHWRRALLPDPRLVCLSFQASNATSALQARRNERILAMLPLVATLLVLQVQLYQEEGSRET